MKRHDEYVVYARLLSSRGKIRCSRLPGKSQNVKYFGLILTFQVVGNVDPMYLVDYLQPTRMSVRSVDGILSI